jgi:hypothetical protein
MDISFTSVWNSLKRLFPKYEQNKEKQKLIQTSIVSKAVPRPYDTFAESIPKHALK